MKAIVYTRYGSPEVLRLQEVAEPVPTEQQVLVRVHAASANALDYRRFEKLSRAGRFVEERLLKTVNQVLGVDIAGTVTAVGRSVTRFKPGDDVFGVTSRLVGGFAEYAVADEGQVALKPAAVSFEQAAAVPVAAVTALRAVRDKARLRPGQRVLVYGAAGGVGTFAVQLAKVLGGEVTAVCGPRNVDLVRSLGAQQVVDYTRDDVTRSGQRFDAIFAVNGDRSLFDYRRVLSPGGTCVVVGGSLAQIFQGLLLGPLLSLVGRQKLGALAVAKVTSLDLEYLGSLLATGSVAPVVERQCRLDAVPEALGVLAAGHARGKLVVDVAQAAVAQGRSPEKLQQGRLAAGGGLPGTAAEAVRAELSHSR